MRLPDSFSLVIVNTHMQAWPADDVNRDFPSWDRSDNVSFCIRNKPKIRVLEERITGIETFHLNLALAKSLHEFCT